MIWGLSLDLNSVLNGVLITSLQVIYKNVTAAEWDRETNSWDKKRLERGNKDKLQLTNLEKLYLEIAILNGPHGQKHI